MPDPSQDYQLEVGGLLMGADTGYELDPRTSGLAIASVREADTARPLDDGVHAGPDYMGTGSFSPTFELEAATEADMLALLDALKAAWKPTREPTTLRLRYGGQTRRIYGKPRGCVPDLSRLQWGYVTVDCRFVKTDPRWYADVATVAALTLATAATGRTYPRTYPLTYGAGSSGTSLLTNAGNVTTRPTATIHGPVTTPRLEHVGRGETLTFDLAVASGDFLEVDFDARTVLLNGTASRYSTLTADSAWWELDPGDNEIRYAAAAGTGGCDITFRSAWL